MIRKFWEVSFFFFRQGDFLSITLCCEVNKGNVCALCTHASGQDYVRQECGVILVRHLRQEVGASKQCD